MTYHVHVTEKALDDADAVLQWLCEQGAVTAGQRWLSALWKAIDTLESHPGRCSLAVEATMIDGDIRELLLGKRRGGYRILFEIRGRMVYILRIRHQAQDTLVATEL